MSPGEQLHITANSQNLREYECNNQTSGIHETLCVMAISENTLGSFIKNVRSRIMTKKRMAFIIILISSCITLMFSGCTSAKVTNLPEELEKIKLEVVKKSVLPEGIFYSIKLTNGSSFIIKQNNVYVSYPMNIGKNAKSLNKAKIEAEGNKIDIRPGDEIILNAFIPDGIFNSDKVDLSVLQYEIKGYIGEVEDINRFGRLGNVLD